MRTKSLLFGSGTALTVSAVGWWAFAEDKKPNYEKIRKEIAKIISEDENRAPTIVRLAWHASGTFSKHDKTGGSDGGTIRHHPESGHGANNGLDKARVWLEQVKKANPEISYGDLYTLAGVVAIEEMDGPKVSWRPGRKDADPSKCSPDGRLPDADKGEPKATAQHVRDIFYRMGFNDREIVALIGAHAVGRCHKENSGYEGPWTRMPTTFTNEFYRELLETKWDKKKWNGKLQYADPRDEVMMLPADLIFIQDAEFRKYVELYAKDQDVWFKDFAQAFQKLEELGVKEFNKSWWSSIFG
jgi:cytochrome c peroxidase